MTPKEKAIDLVDKMKWEGEMSEEDCFNDFAKECAIIAVNVVLKNGLLIRQSQLYKANKIKPTIIYKEYWQQVKEEIQKL